MRRYLLLFIVLLGACTPVIQHDSRPLNADSAQIAKPSERLGTMWGDEMYSQVQTVNLKRLTQKSIDLTQVLYADKDYRGKAIKAISLAAGKVMFSIQTEDHQGMLYRDVGRYYFHAKAGQVYRLVYHNNSSNTYEIVASVGGLDVLTGRPASQHQVGYVLQPYGSITIEGFRKDDSTVAPFVFSEPQVAYADHKTTSIRQNTGVIGTALYQLKGGGKSLK